MSDSEPGTCQMAFCDARAEYAERQADGSFALQCADHATGDSVVPLEVSET